MALKLHFIVNSTPEMFVTWLAYWFDERRWSLLEHTEITQNGDKTQYAFAFHTPQIKQQGYHRFTSVAPFPHIEGAVTTLSLTVECSMSYAADNEPRFATMGIPVFEYMATALDHERIEVTARLNNQLTPFKEFFDVLIADISARWQLTRLSPHIVNGVDVSLPQLGSTVDSDRLVAKRLRITPERLDDWKREIAMYELGLRQQEIADRLGYSIDKVKSDFRDMKKKGYIPPKAS
jgi:hypothetical protein